MPWRRLSVFAVEDDAVQVTWSAGPAGDHELEAGDERLRVRVVDDGSPGAVMIEGLRPATRYPLRVDGRTVTRFRTLPRPPGRVLCRIAMISDLHIGDRHFGAIVPMGERPRPGVEPFALRCARAAMHEAVAWGADALVVKGDLTRAGTGDELDQVGRLLASSPVPVAVVPGNHDVKAVSSHPGPALRRHGVKLIEAPTSMDLPGVRVVLGNTAKRRVHDGVMEPDQIAALADLTRSAPGPAVVVLHHHLQRLRQTMLWPPGIPGPASRALLDALAAANPATLVTSGHTHRYRLRRHGPVLVSTTGSPKDYPGAWAGLIVHEGGVRQVVRRVAAPDCIAWTQYTARAIAGGWSLWSPGLRSHRCFTHVWPDR